MLRRLSAPRDGYSPRHRWLRASIPPFPQCVSEFEPSSPRASVATRGARLIRGRPSGRIVTGRLGTETGCVGPSVSQRRQRSAARQPSVLATPSSGALTRSGMAAPKGGPRRFRNALANLGLDAAGGRCYAPGAASCVGPSPGARVGTETRSRWSTRVPMLPAGCGIGLAGARNGPSSWRNARCAETQWHLVAPQGAQGPQGLGQRAAVGAPRLGGWG
jgi:hypothetical protein